MKANILALLIALPALCACSGSGDEPPIEPPPVPVSEFELPIHTVTNTVWQGRFYYEDMQGKENRVFTKYGARLMQATLRLEIDQQGHCVASIQLPVHEGGTYSPRPHRTYSFGLVGECRRSVKDYKAVFLDIDISRADATKEGYDLLQAVGGRWQVRNDVRRYNDHLELRREGDPFVQNMQYLNLRWMGSYLLNYPNS